MEDDSIKNPQEALSLRMLKQRTSSLVSHISLLHSMVTNCRLQQRHSPADNRNQQITRKDRHLLTNFQRIRKAIHSFGSGCFDEDQQTIKHWICFQNFLAATAAEAVKDAFILSYVSNASIAVALTDSDILLVPTMTAP